MIGDHFPHTQQSLDVYLGLPAEREGIDNFAEHSAAPVRYAHRASARCTTWRARAAWPRSSFARRKPVLLFGDESRDGLICMKVLEIVRDDSGSLVVSEPYIRRACASTRRCS